MKEPAHKILLDRDAAAKSVAGSYGTQLDMLTDMVAYASNLIPRAYNSSEKKLRDVIVCWVLLKQFTSMLDAVDVLARAGAVHAAFVPARVVFESSLYLEWVLASDGEKKAAHHFVADVRAHRAFAEKIAKGGEASSKFFEEMGQMGADAAAKYPTMEADAKKQVAAADALLSRPDFVEANAAFDALKGKQDWYRALGKLNIKAIAKELMRLPEYNIYYRKASEVVHSSAYKQHVSFEKGGTFSHPVRNLADAHMLFNCVSQSSMHTFLRVLAFYRPQEVERCRRKYTEDWREAFLHIPVAVVVPPPKRRS